LLLHGYDRLRASTGTRRQREANGHRRNNSAKHATHPQRRNGIIRQLLRERKRLERREHANWLIFSRAGRRVPRHAALGVSILWAGKGNTGSIGY
jgi:hypothetical protein